MDTKSFRLQNWPGALSAFLAVGLAALTQLGVIPRSLWWAVLCFSIFGTVWFVWPKLAPYVEPFIGRFIPVQQRRWVIALCLAVIPAAWIVIYSMYIPTSSNISLRLEEFGVTRTNPDDPLSPASVLMVVRVQVRETPTSLYQWVLVATHNNRRADSARTVYFDSLGGVWAYGGPIRKRYPGVEWLPRKSGPKALQPGDMVVGMLYFVFDIPDRRLSVSDVEQSTLVLTFRDIKDEVYAGEVPIPSNPQGGVSTQRWPEIKTEIDTVK